MNYTDFSFASPSSLQFGVGKFLTLPALINPLTKNVLIVLGSQSHKTSEYITTVIGKLEARFSVTIITIPTEPTPEMVDTAVLQSQPNVPDIVVAVGGGSVLDAGKAISAMIPVNDGVKNYLEGVGTKTHPGTKIPFIAVPTTSGTGSEATKNAVISEVGENGYKKSLRHNNFIPDTALLDPELAVSCPPSQTAASGMDAFTQLLESFVSTNANPLTDALAVKGLELCAGNLLTCYRNGDDIEARAAMALASYISGLTLANAGLGLVHGFASSIGGYHKIPHGVICSRMMSACNDVTIRELKRADNSFVLKKFATIGRMFGKNSGKNTLYYVDHLLAIINEFTHEMQIPKLSDYGVSSVNYVKIVAATDNKFNPVKLSKEQLAEVLELSI